MSVTTQPQDAAHHARYVPGFHFVTGTLVLINLFWSLYNLYETRTPSSLQGVAIGIILLAFFIYLRAFPLSVQDRVIRLEERLRLARLLPPEMQSRCDEFTADQLISLRFASDAEVPGLANRVLAERITGRKEIKAMVRNWRPDHMRA
jgi:hypothetical protein